MPVDCLKRTVWYRMWVGLTNIWRCIFSLSEPKIYLYNRQRMRRSVKAACKAGPVCKMPLRQTALDELIDALNTSPSFVEMLSGFRTA